jgi:hypothetical protein
MKTTDIFQINRSSRRLNEGLEKTFGKKLNLENFDLHQLQDARNKLRTQISQARAQSGFNETIENDALTQAQFMLDAINAEISQREEFAVEAEDIEFTELEQSQGEEMTKVTEGEIQQASAIVSAKTMVDRVGRWIEELSGMENDTLLQLGDQIRDEMGQEQAKSFISAVAPAIQQALENLKQTRETLATGVRTLTGEEQGAEMLGAEPAGDEMSPAPADEMNMPAEAPAADEFAAAEPAAGGGEAAGREQRESINYESRLLKVLAG